MQKRHVSILDPNTGQARPGVFVTVKDSVTLALASLFADDEVVVLPNPLTTDATGTVAFKAPDGEYDLTVSGPGMIPRTVTKVQIADKDGFAKAGGAMVVHAHDSDLQGGLLDPAHVFSPAGGTIPIRYIMSAEGTSRFLYASTTSCQLQPGVIPLKVGTTWQMRAIGSPLVVTNTGLPANSFLYAYASDVDGATVITFDASTHGPDPEFGVEVKTGDPSRTLVGMVFTNGSAQFQDSSQFRWVASYFRRRNKELRTSAVAGLNPSTGSPSPVALHGNWHTHFVNWVDETFFVTCTMYAFNNTVGQRADLHIGFATTFAAASVASVGAGHQQTVASNVHSVTTSAGFFAGDGSFYVTPMGSAPGGGISTYSDSNQPIVGIVRG